MLLKLRFTPNLTIRTLLTEVSKKTLPKPLLKLRNESFFARSIIIKYAKLKILIRHFES